MKIYIVDLLHTHIKKVGVICFLALILNTSIRSLLFSSDLELTYNYEPIILNCQASCVYDATLMIANSGEETIDGVTATMNFMPKRVSSKVRVINVSAMEPRESDPNIVLNKIDEKWHAAIDNLLPGTLIVVDFSGILLSREDVLRLKDVSVNIHSQSDILEGDPRATKLGRILSSIF